jgi:hypothetical protein
MGESYTLVHLTDHRMEQSLFMRSSGFNLPNSDLAVLKVQLLAVSQELECPQGDTVDVEVVSIETWIVTFGYNASLYPDIRAVPNCVNPKLLHL